MRKIILVDDHSLFRRGLRSLLECYDNYEVVAEASSGEEFLDMLSTIHADIVFMDISMEGISGDVATKRALESHPDLKVIALTMFGEENYYKLMVEAGAKGFLLKDTDIREVVEAIETIANGGDYFSEKILMTITNGVHGSSGQVCAEESESVDILSSRETEILIAVCQGLSNHQIADTLYISKRTVDKHRANIMEKTGCKNTASLVVYAVKQGLVEF
ncbi:MAG: response regulator transcription factor [Rikenellaceae bacterium]